MQLRVRELRKERGWTLQQLADRIGTTAQTVQRLETKNMTVSTDWLERFGRAFSVDPIELLVSSGSADLALRGDIASDGRLLPLQGNEAGSLDVGALMRVTDPVAVRLTDQCNGHPAGTVLICERLSGRNMENAIGHDALAALSEDDIVYGRVLRGQAESFSVVPHRQGARVWYDVQISWLALPRAAIRRL